MLKKQVTAERVKEHFSEIVKGGVTRYELPNLHAFNFVLEDALGEASPALWQWICTGKLWDLPFWKWRWRCEA